MKHRGSSPHRINVDRRNGQRYASLRPSVRSFVRLLDVVWHYDSSPGRRAYCYTQLIVSSPAVAKTIASTHCIYPWRLEGSPGWGGWKYRDGRPLVVTNPSTDRVQRSLTLLIWPTPLPERWTNHWLSLTQLWSFWRCTQNGQSHLTAISIQEYNNKAHMCTKLKNIQTKQKNNITDFRIYFAK